MQGEGESTGKERWKSDGGREIPDPAVAQGEVFTIIKHTLPLYTHLYTVTGKGTDLDSDRDKE